MNKKYMGLNQYPNKQSVHTHLRIIAGIADEKIRYVRDPQTFSIMVHKADVSAYLKKHNFLTIPESSKGHTICNPTYLQNNYLNRRDHFYLLTTNMGYALCSVSRLLSFVNGLKEGDHIKDTILETGLLELTVQKRKEK